MRARSCIGRIGRIGATTAVLAAVGCGSSVAANDAVDWADQVCGVLSPFDEAVSGRPQIDQTDPAGTVRGIDDYLTTASAALQDALDGLHAAGPAPVPGGDAFVGRLSAALTQAKASFDSASSRLPGVDASNAESLAATLPAVLAPLQQLSSLPDPTEGLESGEELRHAAEQAPNCQALRSTGG